MKDSRVILIVKLSILSLTGKDVFFWADRVLMISTHHKLCIIYQVNTEDQSPNRRINESNSLSGKEYSNKTKQHKYDCSYEQNTYK